MTSLLTLARTCEKQNAFEEAAYWHERIVEKNPLQCSSNLFLAQWYFRQGAYEQALPYFERLWLLDPLFFEHPAHRVLKLGWLLASIKSNGVDGLEPQLAEVRRWHNLTAAEHALRHTLLTLAGDRTAADHDVQAAWQKQIWQQSCSAPTAARHRTTTRRLGLALTAAVLLVTLAWWRPQKEDNNASGSLPPAARESHSMTGQKDPGATPLAAPSVAPPRTQVRPLPRTREPLHAPVSRKAATTTIRRTHTAKHPARTPTTVPAAPGQPSIPPPTDSSLSSAKTTHPLDKPAPVHAPLQSLTNNPPAFMPPPSPPAPPPDGTNPAHPTLSVATASLAALSTRLPYAAAFPVSEREFAVPPQRLWQAAAELLARETDILHLADAERGILHGEVLRRGLRPRAHKLKPLGHYLALITPGPTPATSRLQLQVLVFDWRTGKPLADAAPLSQRLVATLVKQLSGESSPTRSAPE
ncbi:MAG: hypothetical protein NZ578_09560 [Candidatus Binatia bacterium]|nr:hypothetical protein [Candidatus Binatia bacterium]